jgi:hypothetical protein
VNAFCPKVLAVTSLAVLLSIGPALADRFECYPSSQTGGGDTRRIVINIEFYTCCSSRTGCYFRSWNI